jgi:hypothetical protein
MRRRTDTQDQERSPAKASDIVFGVGLVALTGAFYALAGVAAWVAWHALIVR